MTIRNQVKFATYNWFKISLLCFRHKLEHPEHIAVVRDGDSLLTIRDGFIHERWDMGGSVEKGVVGVVM